VDAVAYQQYLRETDDWLKTARAKWLSLMLERHLSLRDGAELLEVGAGAGQNLASLSRFGVVDAIEINPFGREAIRTRGGVRDVFAEPVPFVLDRRYDAVCALDVIEHIADDRGAMRWMTDLLRPGGILVVTVPAYQWLFSDHDRALGHHRRYTRARLADALPEGMRILEAAYFTHLAFPLAVGARMAWTIRRRFSRADHSAKQSSPRTGIAAHVLGWLQRRELAWIARGYAPPFGLSAYLVAERTGNGDR
jgi:SAM-dependent methyltransferase